MFVINRPYHSRLPRLQQGAFFTLAPAPFLFAGASASCCSNMRLWYLLIPALSTFAGIMGGILLGRCRPAWRICSIGWVLGCLVSGMNYLMSGPFSAMVGGSALIFFGFTVFDTHTPSPSLSTPVSSRDIFFLTRSAVLFIPVMILLSFFASDISPVWVRVSLAGSLLTVLFLFLRWLFMVYFKKRMWLLLTCTGMALAGFGLWGATVNFFRIYSVIGCVLMLAILVRSSGSTGRGSVWDLLINHPARILLITFLILCCTGTLLLQIPAAVVQGGISILDSAFTAVSAVCVTGLCVVDTPVTFTIAGQAFILLLIQLGGLGIMSIATVALHVFGRRISMRQERMMARMTDSDTVDLVASLSLVLKYTLAVELAGTVLLWGCFRWYGEAPGMAAWRGLFTSVSAFCNAGFALQSSSLIPYREMPVVLHIVGVLIILGGLAPATALMFGSWISKKMVPLSCHLAWMTTCVLLVAGFAGMLVFEWNGMLAGLSIPLKCHNAWFQSVTLRTAGFNSLPFDGVGNPMFLLMLFFMFIGGSPGGTAGGVKTVTLAVLMLAFWTDITNRSEVVYRNRHLDDGLVRRAVTIIISGGVIWFLIILMLEITQPLPVRDLIFEATSAIGTVGLSTGITGQLDEIGKIIIMLAMFAGRVGPMTLFMILSTSRTAGTAQYPVAKISLN